MEEPIKTRRRARKMEAEPLLGACVTVTKLKAAQADGAAPGCPVFIGACADPDGQTRRVFVLGAAKPGRAFSGRIVAVILFTDSEDSCVAAPEGCVLNQAEIIRALTPCLGGEKADFVCLYEKSCGAIVCRPAPHGMEYLLLFQRKSQTWSFPKGHAEPDESGEQTARREVREETGLEVSLLPGFCESVSYPVHGAGTKFVHLYLAGASSGEVKIRQKEIVTCVWVGRVDALALLPRVGYDAVLSKAEAALQYAQ